MITWRAVEGDIVDRVRREGRRPLRLAWLPRGCRRASSHPYEGRFSLRRSECHFHPLLKPGNPCSNIAPITDAAADALQT